MTIRVAVIGYGHAGRGIHCPLISAVDQMKVEAVVTNNQQRVQQVRADLPGAIVYSTYSEVIENASNFDLVVIATTNSSHVSYALQALTNGLHVVIDKPMAGTVAEAESVFFTAERNQRTATVFHNRRWDGDFLTVRELAETRQLGNVVTFQSSFERFRPEPTGRWRETGAPEELPGLLFDLGSHLVDQAIQLWGPVSSVLANARNIRNARASDDDTLIVLEHESGVTSELHATVFAAHPGPRFRLLGTSGSATIFGIDQQEDDLGKGHTPRSTNWGKSNRVISIWDVNGHAVEKPVATGQWGDFYSAVALALTNNMPIPVSTSSALQTVATLEAAVTSNAKRSWIDVQRLT